jgi:hypothetical protein
MILVNTSESVSGSVIELDTQTGKYKTDVNLDKLKAATGLGGFAILDGSQQSLVAIVVENKEFYLILGKERYLLSDKARLSCNSSKLGFGKTFELIDGNKKVLSFKYKPVVKSKLLRLLDFFYDPLDKEMDDIFLFLSCSYNDPDWRKSFGEKWGANLVGSG